MSGPGSLGESFSETGFEHLAPQRSPSRWDDEEGESPSALLKTSLCGKLPLWWAMLSRERCHARKLKTDTLWVIVNDHWSLLVLFPCEVLTFILMPVLKSATYNIWSRKFDYMDLVWSRCAHFLWEGTKGKDDKCGSKKDNEKPDPKKMSAWFFMH